MKPWTLPLALALIATIAPASADEATSKRRNVLFLFTDDQRCRHDPTPLGNAAIRTPNLDGLAGSGVRLPQRLLHGRQPAGRPACRAGPCCSAAVRSSTCRP